MALSKTVETAHGFDAQNAYHRVEQVLLHKKDSMSFYLRSYKDTSKPFFGEQMFNCDYVLNESNPIQQAYEHLKTLPEFADATDV